MNKGSDPKAFAEEITGQVHDLWLDLDEGVVFDKRARVVAIPLFRKIPGPIEKTLTIRTVRSMHVRDTEQVRWYDINTVRIDISLNRVLIRCSVPLQIQFDVLDPFAISVA